VAHTREVGSTLWPTAENQVLQYALVLVPFLRQAIVQNLILSGPDTPEIYFLITVHSQTWY
jgi:hypothetical protein